MNQNKWAHKIRTGESAKVNERNGKSMGVVRRWQIVRLVVRMGLQSVKVRIGGGAEGM